MAAGITAIVLTRNEEMHITQCISSLRWCDEVLVIDDMSTDKTGFLAEKAGATVIQHKLEGNFSQQRNYGLSLAKNDWVLFVDADEEVSLSLQYEIMNHVTDQFHHNEGFFLHRIDEMWEKKLAYGEVGNTYLLRLAKKTAGEWQGAVHEMWMIKGKAAKLQNPLMHYPHQTIREFLAEINLYSDIRAHELQQKHIRVKTWQIVAYPLAKFIKDYIFLGGFLDGTAGFIVAMMMSFHSFLVRGKVWLSYEKGR